MINVVNEFGHSFKGLAGYLLRGPDNDNPERVDWVMTHNVGTDDAELAWKIMVDTARRSGELKKAAGFGAGGRRSKGPVMHYVLSWKPEEAEKLTKEEMQRAALESLKVLGKKRSKSRSVKTQTGDEHQALIVSHQDRGHCHVHIMLNRVNPEFGLMLPSYNDHIRLSDWAHEYRKEMGLEHLTPERVKNYEARKRSRQRPVPGVRVKGTPRIPRHIYELQAKPVNDNKKHLVNKAVHKRRDRRLTKLSRGIELSQTKERKSMDRAYLDRVRDIRRGTDDAIARANTKIHARFDKKWAQMAAEHDAELRHYQQQESTWLGRKKNALGSLASVDFQSLVSGQDRKQILTEIFGAFTTQGASLELLKRKLRRQVWGLNRLQKKQENVARDKCHDEEISSMAQNQTGYLVDRREMLGKHQYQRDRLKALWTTQRKARVSAFMKNMIKSPAKQRADDAEVKESFNEAASPPREVSRTEDERQRQIEEAKERLKQSREERKKRPRRPRRKP